MPCTGQIIAMTGSTHAGQAVATASDASVVAPALPWSAGRSRRTWAYPATTGDRDLRIDFLRGLAVLFVVVDQIDIASLFHLISHERIGVVSGAELFVVLSGIVLGMVHRRRAIDEGWRSVATRMWSRALLLYVTCIAVILAAYAISFLPFVDGDVLTTWTDAGSGTTDPMYLTTPLLRDYPVPPQAVLDILFLNVGPYQFNVIGLYVVLLCLAPLAFQLLLRGRWWIVAGLSWGVYAANMALHVRLFPSQFEGPFPLLTWQVLFFSGMVAGFYWKPITGWFDRPTGRMTMIVAVVLALAFIFYAWNNPGLAQDPFGLRLSIIPQETFETIYESWFQRDSLGILRVANVAVLVTVAYALLSRCWVPLNRALGWLLVPLGSATLYVFILHLLFVLIAGSLPALQGASVWTNTAAHTVIILSLWLMVKNRVFYRWIPR